jgi:hypothetical protein
MRMAHEREIKERLGVKRKLDAGFSLTARVINVAATGERSLYASVGIHVREAGIMHRTEVECPACHKRMSMGRLNQHYPCTAAAAVREILGA